jgi:secreted trypsin-like serine protease
MKTPAPASRRTDSGRPGRRHGAVAVVLLAVGFACLLGGGSASAAVSPAALRVVSGTPVAQITSFPFQVALFIQGQTGPYGQSTLAFCGGVIIDPTQVVTAAHCVTDEITGQPVSPQSVTVLAGSATLPPQIPTAPAATGIAVDPSYDPGTADYDVAVVTLQTPLYTGSPRADGTATVAPIPLITPALAALYANPDATPAEPVVISGWGETSPLGVGAHDNTSSLPQQLQAAQTHLVSDATCTGDYAGLGSIGVPAITSRMLCAGEPAGGVDACAGDSGGPMVVDIDNPTSPPGDYVLAGLIDFGAGCAQPGYPGVYVRVATAAITSFISQQAQAAGQALTTAPAPVGATPQRVVTTSGTARLTATTGRVTRLVARVAIRCTGGAACTGSLTLRTTTTVGIAHFTIPANTTAKVSVKITPHGERQLVTHKHRLRTRATLRTSGSAVSERTFTITG